MQEKKKQEILKLLNLDNMINQYLNDTALYHRQTFTNRRAKINNNENKVTKMRSDKKGHTIDVSSDFANKRAYSAKAMIKDNIQHQRVKIDHKAVSKNKTLQLASTYSTLPTSTQDNFRASHLKPKNTYSKLFKSDALIEFDQQELARGKKFNYTKVTEESSKAHSIIDFNSKDNNNNQKTEKDIVKIKKQKVKLRLGTPYMQAKPRKIGSVLKGRYKIQKFIARGLSGEVYKGWDILSQRNVAIKIIDAANIQYQFIKQLQHPNLITYYNSFLEDGKRHIVLQYLPKNLAQVIRKQKLSESSVKKIFKSIVSGLLYLHSLSYAHRDIKLDNILASEDLSIIKFIDFGLCVDTAECDKKQSNRFCGTTSYMAPQVIGGKCKEPKKADIWSLGIVLYTLLFGRYPFGGRQEEQIHHKIRNSKTVYSSTISQQLKKLLESMLQKEPSKRPTMLQILNSHWLCD